MSTPQDKPKDTNLRVGGGWTRKTNSGGEFISLSLEKKILDQIHVDDRGNIALTVWAARELKTERSPNYNIMGSPQPFIPNTAKVPVAPTKPVATKKVASAPVPVETVEDDEAIL